MNLARGERRNGSSIELFLCPCACRHVGVGVEAGDGRCCMFSGPRGFAGIQPPSFFLLPRHFRAARFIVVPTLPSSSTLSSPSSPRTPSHPADSLFSEKHSRHHVCPFRGVQGSQHRAQPSCPWRAVSNVMDYRSALPSSLTFRASPFTSKSSLILWVLGQLPVILDDNTDTLIAATSPWCCTLV